MGEKAFLENLSFEPAESFSEFTVFGDTECFGDQLVATFADEPENLRVVGGDTLTFAGFGECHGVSGIAAEQRAIDIENDDLEFTHRMHECNRNSVASSTTPALRATPPVPGGEPGSRNFQTVAK